MTKELSDKVEMIYIGLLTHQQKQAGYFVAQDEDFIYLFHRNEGKPNIIAIFPYETVTVKAIRDEAERRRHDYDEDQDRGD